MAAKAFLLIEAIAGRTLKVYSTLKQLEGVKSVDQVTGPYDIIAIIEGESLTHIGNLIITKIQLVPGISKSVTCLTY